MTASLPTDLDGWLSYAYKAELAGSLPPALAQFKRAIAGDGNLKTQAIAKMAELDDLIGVRGRKACHYSTKYDDFLHGALDAGR